MPPINYSSIALALPAALFVAWPVRAQITPDASLPSGERSIVNSVDGGVLIQNGAVRGSNLFHSFEEFSVPAGTSATFDNGLGIENIFSRVTGSSASLIDGGLGANGGANLFFLNPNGILFGPGATLNLGGSFIAATVNRVDFEDGVSWGLGGEPLLTIARPIGLELGGSDGPIRVLDTGNTLVSSTTALTTVFPLVEVDPSPGLDIGPGQTIALLSGTSVEIDGGLIRAPDGRLGIISAGPGTVAITPALSGGLDLSFQGSGGAGEIILTNGALLDASGPQGGFIGLAGGDINLQEGSVLLTGGLVNADPSTSGVQISGELLSIDGLLSGSDRGAAPLTPSLISQIPAGIIIQSAAPTGGTGPVTLDVGELSLSNGGYILSNALSASAASNIEINAEEVSILDFSPTLPTFFSVINTNTSIFSSVPSGYIAVTADQIRIGNRGTIFTTTVGAASAGDINIQVKDLYIEGQEVLDSQVNNASGIISSSFRITDLVQDGDAGDVFVNAETINLSADVGRLGIVSTTFNNGDAGNVSVQASESIQIYAGEGANSAISSAISPPDISFRGANSFGVIENSVPGSAGSVLVQAPIISIEGPGDARINASNEGLGTSGDVVVSAESIYLIDGGNIQSLTSSGDGGNIFLSTEEAILNDGLISADSRGQGAGGNINIQSNFLALLDASSITANAEDDRGGRVTIEANSLLQSNDSIISATSALGPEFDGQVVLLVPTVDPVSSSIQTAPPVQFVHAIATCQQIGEGSFVISGRGGTPVGPESHFSVTPGWSEPVSTTSPEAYPLKDRQETSSVANSMTLTPEGLISFVGSQAPVPALANCRVDTR